MIELQEVKIVHVYETKVWVESDMMGARHVVVQHEGMEPFTYCTFNYNYAHTSNSQTYADAEAMAISLGAKQPIEFRHRDFNFNKPTKEEILEQIEALQSLLEDDEDD